MGRRAVYEAESEMITVQSIAARRRKQRRYQATAPDGGKLVAGSYTVFGKKAVIYAYPTADGWKSSGVWSAPAFAGGCGQWIEAVHVR